MKKNFEIKTAHHVFPAYISIPEKPKAALIILEEIWGVDKHIKSVCDRFAAEGYAVISPELLGDTGILEKISPAIFAEMKDPKTAHAAQAKMREAIQPIREKAFAATALEKLRASYEHLKEKAPDLSVGIMGFCFGGTWSFYFASEEKGIKACVPFYGQPPEPIETVSKISAPVLAFYGEQDHGLIESLPKLTEAMKTYKKDFTYKVYPDAGHAFFNDTRKEAYRKDAAEDAWIMTLAFLSKNLG